MILSPVWFLEKQIDLEYQQYVLLGFLQKIEKMFKENDITLLEEVKYHSKNIECYINTRALLTMKGFPEPTEKHRKLHKQITSLPDSDVQYQEAVKICKWSLKKLQEKVKEGGVIHKRVEGSLKMYFIGKETLRTSGYLMIRYMGSSVCEVHRMIYDERTKTVVIKHLKNYSMPGKKDFGDVKIQVLEDEKKMDDLFVAVEGQLSYNTKKTTIPVLKSLLITNVFDKRSGSPPALSWKL